MFQAIAWAASILMGLSGGNAVTPGSTNPDSQDVQHVAMGCYTPDPSDTVTLTWPDNFVNLTDYRTTLSPHLFGYFPRYFSSQGSCRETIFKDTTGDVPDGDVISRTYIKVRSEVRIPSCKTDELGGPYGIGECPGATWVDPPKNPVEISNRGVCVDPFYPELRKIAEISRNGVIEEVFWTAHSHNVGCDFNPNTPNCPWEEGTKIISNLREFIYVLKSREAFDPNDPRKGCTILWDSGSGNENACSHYFDVYMAEDLYAKTLTGADPEDPDYDTYKFIKEFVENCQENSLFSPIVDVPGLRIPPQFFEKPFLAQDFYTPQPGKIVPGDATRLANYEKFVLSTATINPYRSNLLELSTPTEASVTECNSIATPTPHPDGTTPLPSCYAAIGTITISGNNQTHTYTVYSRPNTPQTFYLKNQSGTDPLLYTYIATERTTPTRNEHDPSLQLSQLRFSSENQWTWATPVCKPALYFYPPQPTDLNVRLELDGALTESDPLYDPKTGWTITAHPDGTINNRITNHESRITENEPTTIHPYLYYEADIRDVDLPKEGWIVERSALRSRISALMKTIGFNNKEIADFLEYWEPRLQEKPYYFLGLIPEEVINQKEKLIIQPTTNNIQPATIIRARFVFEGLDQPVSVKEPTHIPDHQRTGFVVTDWGGSLVGRSCNDITVK